VNSEPQPQDREQLKHRSEWAKMRALRSTWWCAQITVVLTGLAAWRLRRRDA
jgi:hypothetical protein